MMTLMTLQLEKKRQANPDNYVRNRNKLANLRGEFYITKKGKEVKKNSWN